MLARHLSRTALLVALAALTAPRRASAQRPDPLGLDTTPASQTLPPQAIDPRPNPTGEQLRSLELIEHEGAAFAERARAYRAFLASLEDRASARRDAALQTLHHPDPLPDDAPRNDLDALPLAAPEAVPSLRAILTQHWPEARDGHPSALYLHAMERLTATLSEARAGDASRCAEVLAPHVRAPRLRRGAPCAGLLRVLDDPSPRPPWDADLLQRLALRAFHTDRFAECAALLRVYAARYPTDAGRPLATLLLADALDRLGLSSDARAARLSMTDFSRGTRWSNANRPRSGEAHARTLATLREVLERDRAGADRPSLERRAETLAAVMHMEPGTPDAYELWVERVWALRQSGHLDWAIAAIENPSPRPASEESTEERDLEIDLRESALIQAVARGTIDPCVAVRAAVNTDRLAAEVGPSLGDAVTRCATPLVGPSVEEGVPIPALARALLRARLRYLYEVPTSDGATLVRWSGRRMSRHSIVRLSLVLALLRFGWTMRAHEWFRNLHPCGRSRLAEEIAVALSHALVAPGAPWEGEEQETVLANYRDATTRCAYRYTPMIDYNPWQRAIGWFRQAERATGAAAAAEYERAGAELYQIAQTTRDDRVPLGLFYAALAWERASRHVSAADVYDDIVRRFDGPIDLDALDRDEVDEDVEQRLNILEVSRYRAGINHERVFDYDAALARYAEVATDPRFVHAHDHTAHVHDALVSRAFILSGLARWSEALAAWCAFLPHASTPSEAATARYHIAANPFRAGRWREAITSLTAYLRVATAPEDTRYRERATQDLVTARQRLRSPRSVRRAPLGDYRRVASPPLVETP